MSSQNYSVARTPRRLLVTGGAGFIGSNFVYHWLAHYPNDQITVLDKLTYAGNKENLARALTSPNCRFVQGDINQEDLIDALVRQKAIDTVVHFAAESHVDRSILGPDAFLTTNILGTHTLLKVVRGFWEPNHYLSSSGQRVRFHHVSTDEVYGSLKAEDPPFCETTPYAPNSPYSASKAASDHLVRAYHYTYGLPVTMSNCSNNYGAYQFPEKLIPLMITHALDGKPLPVYGDGQNVRDWLHVEDHCYAIEKILNQGKEGETYNVGGSNEWRNIDLIHTIITELEVAFALYPELKARFPNCPASLGQSVTTLIQYVPDRLGHDRRYAINADKIHKELDFWPKWQIENGLKETLHWYFSHESWWRALQKRNSQ